MWLHGGGGSVSPAAKGWLRFGICVKNIVYVDYITLLCLHIYMICGLHCHLTLYTLSADRFI
jgi:hypothetical protein